MIADMIQNKKFKDLKTLKTLITNPLRFRKNLFGIYNKNHENY